MYVVVVEFDIRPAHTAAFVQRVRQQESLREEAGCHVFDVCLDPGRANFILLYEVSSNREAFETHLGSAHFRAFDTAVRDWLDGKKIFSYERLEPN